jgi:hypothetical protein
MYHFDVINHFPSRRIYIHFQVLQCQMMFANNDVFYVMHFNLHVMCDILYFLYETSSMCEIPIHDVIG